MTRLDLNEDLADIQVGVNLIVTYSKGQKFSDLSLVSLLIVMYKCIWCWSSCLTDVLGHNLSEVLSMEFGNGEFVFTWLT